MADISGDRLASPQIGDNPGAWQVWLDLIVTRRKVAHTVIDPSGAPIYHSRFLSECLAYLANQGVREYLLVPNRSRSLALPLDPIQIERQD